MEGHAKKCLERYCELENKTTEHLHTESKLHVLTTINSKKKWDLWENCSQIVLKCLYFDLIGRPDIFMVRKQTCPCGHKMDSSFVTNV